MNCELLILAAIIVIAIAFAIWWICAPSNTPSEQVQKPAFDAEKELYNLRSSLISVRYQLGLLQKVGKRRMRASDLRNGLTAWREIDGILHEEYIETNKSLTKDEYRWCYAVGGPWGHVRLDIKSQVWWVENKKKP